MSFILSAYIVCAKDNAAQPRPHVEKHCHLVLLLEITGSKQEVDT